VSKSGGNRVKKHSKIKMAKKSGSWGVGVGFKTNASGGGKKKKRGFLLGVTGTTQVRQGVGFLFSKTTSFGKISTCGVLCGNAKTKSGKIIAMGKIDIMGVNKEKKWGTRGKNKGHQREKINQKSSKRFVNKISYSGRKSQVTSRYIKLVNGAWSSSFGH